jgi:hypothetical protein
LTAAAGADIRFLLPHPPAAADVIGHSPLADALEAGGVEARRGARVGHASVAVVGRGEMVDAVRRGYDTLLVAGTVPRRSLRASGYSATGYLSLPSLSEPSLLVPLRGGPVAAYALANWTFPQTPFRRARNRVARELVRRDLLPPLAPTVTVVSRIDGPPYLVGAAENVGVPREVRFFMRSGGVDALARSTFFLFDRAAHHPTWLLKFARVRGYADPFDRDERGLALVAQTPAPVRRHAPQLLGRFAVDGMHGSVETAAIGKPLADRLRATGDRAQRLALVDAVATWILALGRATTRTDSFAPERDRLAGLLAETAAPPDLARRLPELPTVLQHNDLGCWNIIFGADSFTAVDWESTRPAGLPLWDLWYFLLDALAAVDAVRREAREAHFRALFRGELSSSAVLFEWTRRAVTQHDVPPAAVGSLATLCWLHHGRSHLDRRDTLVRHGRAASEPNPFPFARVWLEDARLGPEWSVWQA